MAANNILNTDPPKDADTGSLYGRDTLDEWGGRGHEHMAQPQGGNYWRDTLDEWNETKRLTVDHEDAATPQGSSYWRDTLDEWNKEKSLAVDHEEATQPQGSNYWRDTLDEWNSRRREDEGMESPQESAFRKQFNIPEPEKELPRPAADRVLPGLEDGVPSSAPTTYREGQFPGLAPAYHVAVHARSGPRRSVCGAYPARLLDL